jgi:hypothetical protein
MAAKGTVRGHGAALDGAIDATLVTPGESALTDGPTRAVYVGGSGHLNVTMVGGTTVLFSNVAAGTVLPLQVTHILSSSTTATLIVALY